MWAQPTHYQHLILIFVKNNTFFYKNISSNLKIINKKIFKYVNLIIMDKISEHF